MSRVWTAETNLAVASVPLSGVKQGVGSAFRSLYAVPPTPPAVPSRNLSADPEPQVDLVEQASMEAFTQGFDEGCRVTAEAMSAEAEANNRLADAVEMLVPAPNGMLSTMLSATVVRLVEQIVGEVDIDIDRLVERCDTVAAFIDENGEKNALHLHPDDLGLLEGENIGVTLVPDKLMPRGSVRLETADGWVEDGPDVRLARLRALLDDMEGRA